MQTIQKIQKDLFGTPETFSHPKSKRVSSKHQMSKKNAKHNHKFSKGERKHFEYVLGLQ